MTVKDVKTSKVLTQKVKEALLHIHKVTGKWGLGNVDPMNCKRWSEKCWDHYHILVESKCLLCFGKTIGEADADFITEFMPSKSEWIGRVTTGRWDNPIGKPCDKKSK